MRTHTRCGEQPRHHQSAHIANKSTAIEGHHRRRTTTAALRRLHRPATGHRDIRHPHPRSRTHRGSRYASEKLEAGPKLVLACSLRSLGHHQSLASHTEHTRHARHPPPQHHRHRYRHQLRRYLHQKQRQRQYQQHQLLQHQPRQYQQ